MSSPDVENLRQAVRERSATLARAVSEYQARTAARWYDTAAADRQLVSHVSAAQKQFERRRADSGLAQEGGS